MRSGSYSWRRLVSSSVSRTTSDSSTYSLLFEVADMFEADDTPLLCEWFKLRLRGQLPGEGDQIAAALVLENLALESNEELLEHRVHEAVARRRALGT